MRNTLMITLSVVAAAGVLTSRAGADKVAANPSPQIPAINHDAAKDGAKSAATPPIRVMESVANLPKVENNSTLRNNHGARVIAAGAANARIVNAKGDVLVQAAPKHTIADCVADPRSNRILIYWGNSDYSVFEPSTKRNSPLPQSPPGLGKIAFNRWHWIDDNALLGQSGDYLGGPKTPDSDTVEIKPRLYLYQISNNVLSEVRLPDSVHAKLFYVSETLSGGYARLVNLTSAVESNLPEVDLGWFKVPTR